MAPQRAVSLPLQAYIHLRVALESSLTCDCLDACNEASIVCKCSPFWTCCLRSVMRDSGLERTGFQGGGLESFRVHEADVPEI